MLHAKTLMRTIEFFYAAGVKDHSLGQANGSAANGRAALGWKPIHNIGRAGDVASDFGLPRPKPGRSAWTFASMRRSNPIKTMASNRSSQHGPPSSFPTHTDSMQEWPCRCRMPWHPECHCGLEMSGWNIYLLCSTAGFRESQPRAA